VQEYGALELFYVTASVLRGILGMMISHAALRFYFEYKEEDQRKRVISSALIFLVVISLIGVLALWNLGGYVSRIFFKTDAYVYLFKIILVFVFFDLTKEVGLAFLRAKERSFLYMSFALTQLVSQILLNYYFVVCVKSGIKGIIIGNLLGSILPWIGIMYVTIRYCGIVFDMKKIKQIMHYSFPFLFSALIGIVLNNVDRILLNYYCGLSAVGLYALALRFGIGLKDLIVEPFTLNFGQARFAIMNDDNAKYIYTRTLTYFLLVLVFIGFAISIFARDILVLLSSSSFQSTYKVIPVVLFGVMMTAVTYVFQTGILISKKTKYILYTNIVAACCILLLNILLAPRWGIYGTALATVGTNIIAAVLTYFFSQRLYRIDFEFKRILKIFIMAFLLYLFYYFAIERTHLTFGMAIILKLVLVVIFPFSLVLLSFYNSREIARIQHLIHRRR